MPRNWRYLLVTPVVVLPGQKAIRLHRRTVTREQRMPDPLVTASEASTEFVAASYRDSFFKGSPLIATARAGNVIGGGDWALDRIVPDLARAQAKGEKLVIRAPTPSAVARLCRPLAGYLQLAQNCWNKKTEFQGPWNSAEGEDIMSVSALLDRMKADYVVQANKTCMKRKS